MGPLELLRVALRALRAHPLRSMLTTLGVVIAVWTIVSVVSVMVGVNDFVATRIFSLSPDVFVVTQFGIITSREQFLSAIKRKPLTERDVERLAGLCESCDEVGMTMQGTRTVHAGSHRVPDVTIQGTTANVAWLQNLDIAAGRYFTENEYEHRAPVAVIGHEIREELFSRRDPIGHRIWIAGIPHKVIGVLTKQGSVLGQDLDTVVYTPLRSARRYMGRGGRNFDAQLSALVRARGGVPGVAASQDEVLQVFRWLRKTPPTGEDPVGVVTGEAIQALWRGISRTTYAVLFIISSVSLLVGAVIVANIMLVSVVERTREIGLRLALGARKRDLRRQFLLEAALLAVCGGILGTMLGMVTAYVVDSVSPFPAVVWPPSVVLAIVCAGLSGVVAGLLPAIKASNLAPIEALHHE